MLWSQFCTLPLRYLVQSVYIANRSQTPATSKHSKKSMQACGYLNCGQLK